MSRFPIAREGVPFFLPLFAAGGLLLAWGTWTRTGAALVLIGLFVVYFFRDPERAIGGTTTSVVSPADGRIVRLRVGADGTQELSIFLSPLDVHVNRAPVDGKLNRVEYRPGRFRPAFVDGASHENEQVRLAIEGDAVELEMRQVTGVLVRRIVLWKKAGERLVRGERIGIMKFGSRVDLLLPASVALAVREGDRVCGGTTVLGEVRPG